MNNYNNSNNASTTISAWISASATTLLVDNGAILPNAPFLLTLEHMDNEKVTVREIVKCTEKIGNSLTIVRSAWICVQDDTATPKVQNNTPHSFWVGDFASIYWTSEQVKDIQDEINQKLNITDFQAWTYVYSSTSTWTDAYAITIPWTITNYQLGQIFRFMADVGNTWNATLNINWIWAIEILKNHDKHLESGDIEAWQIVEVAFDGTNFQMNSQIAQVVSLEDINSLNYNDLTCYAGEEINSNDLIVTNWNSFNPDWADEDLSVWGTTINKYAIGFIGNWETTDTFSIKTSVIEWFEPDSVTINLETDDNWKPSGTVLATSADLNAFKIRVDPTNTDSSSISNLYAFYMNSLWKWEGEISYDRNTRIMSVSWNRYNYSLDLSSLITSTDYKIYWKTKDDKYFIFSHYSSSFYDTFGLLHLPNPTTTDWAIFQAIDASIIKDGSWVSNARLYWLCISEDWKYMFAWITSWSWSIWKLFKIKLTTPFVVNTYDTIEELTVTNSSQNIVNIGLINNFWQEYLVYNKYSSTNSQKTIILLWLDSDYTIKSQTDTRKLAQQFLIPDYREPQPRFYWSSAELLFWYGWNYDWLYKSTITTTTTFVSEKWKKYWLTIAPIITWSVVDCVKIFDKEGEYYSQLAIRDLNNWSNVANKTPYIDANCIRARYAKKIDNRNIKLYKTVCWFANWDFSNLEVVNYCFKWVKTWFTWLEENKKYFSQGGGWIWTKNWWNYVWTAIDETTLLVDFKNLGWPRILNSSFSDSKPSSDTWHYTYQETVNENCILKISYYGILTIYKNGEQILFQAKTTTTDYYMYVFEDDEILIDYVRYDSGTGAMIDITYSFIK